jgi:hypothetical protein
MRGVSLIEQQMVGCFERFGVIDLTGGGNGVQIGRSYLLEVLAAGCCVGILGSFVGGYGRFAGGNLRTSE